MWKFPFENGMLDGINVRSSVCKKSSRRIMPSAHAYTLSINSPGIRSICLVWFNVQQRRYTLTFSISVLYIHRFIAKRKINSKHTGLTNEQPPPSPTMKQVDPRREMLDLRRQKGKDERGEMVMGWTWQWKVCLSMGWGVSWRDFLTGEGLRINKWREKRIIEIKILFNLIQTLSLNFSNNNFDLGFYQNLNFKFKK